MGLSLSLKEKRIGAVSVLPRTAFLGKAGCARMMCVSTARGFPEPPLWQWKLIRLFILSSASSSTELTTRAVPLPSTAQRP